MIFKEKPLESSCAFDVVACYIEYDGKFILLERNSDKPHGNTWGLPAGKVNQGEDVIDAVIREVKEETGIAVNALELLTLSSLWVENNGTSFNYHSFLCKLNYFPSVILNNEEHQNYTWVTPKESLERELIHDLADCNRLFYNL